MKFVISFLVMMFISAMLLSCSTSPMGRKQMTIMPESQMASMGTQSFDELKKTTPIEKDPATNAYVKCITDPLLKAVGPVEGVSSWEVVVFNDKQVNAFALPGGKIGVYSGILKVANTPDQLAAVLGHEVGHVLAKHGNERVSQGMASQVALAGAQIALGKNGQLDKKSQLIVAGLGVGLQFGVLLPFSRTHESEADIIGLELMSKAGFNPEQSIVLWQNMSKATGGKAPPQWMSTHPSDKTRIDNLSRNIPKYEPYYQKALANGTHPECRL
jgi:predicted Zn-dependent protease